MNREDKRCVILIVLTIFIVLAIVFLIGNSPRRDINADYGRPAEYVVLPGDTLYSIAESLGISDWRRWCYEVKKVNGMNGSAIYPGERVVIFVTEKALGAARTEPRAGHTVTK